MAELELGGKMKEIEEEIKITFRNQEFKIVHRCYQNEETGEKFTTNKQDDDMMWAVFRAYWERRGFEHFYDIDGYREEQDPASEDLEQAIDDYTNSNFSECYDGILISDAYSKELTLLDVAPMARYFAQWQKAQMMKDAMECHIDYYDGPILDFTQKQLDDALETNGAKVGDKVKVIIIKE